MSQPMATARAFPRSWPEGAPRRALAPLRVVPAAIRRQGHGGFALLCIGLLTTGLLGLLLLNTTLGQGAFTMQDLRVRSTGLAGQEEALTQAIDQNRSPAALASRASAMGMVPSTSMAFVRLSDGKVLGTATPTTRTPGFTIVTALTVPVPPPAAAKPATTKPLPTKPAKPDATKPVTTKPAIPVIR